MTHTKVKLPKLLTIIRKLNFPKKLGVLEFLFGSNLSKNGVCWVDCSNGIEWKLDLSDPCHRWIVYGKYEGGNGINFAQDKLKNGGVFVDSGANIGQWSLYLSGGKGVRTLAFEPVDSQRKWLKESVTHQDNWLYNIYNCGLGSTEKKQKIQCDSARSTVNMDWYIEKKLPTQTIQMKKLDSILSNEEIEEVSFWKLDVEGAELEALLGAKNYLLKKKIETIFFECHPSNYVAVKSLLEGFGYALYDLVNGKLELKVDKEIPITVDLVSMPKK